ncbi:MAG: amylo-alpha-1,6-glucosidase [Chthoniobacteraceae bacterium]
MNIATEEIPNVELDILQEAKQKCLEILCKNISVKGVAASIENYPQVWARDSVITLFGATVDGNSQLLEAFRFSLETLGAHQDRFGHIPNYVRLDNSRVDYQSCDSTIWFIIGSCIYGERSGDTEWLKRQAPAIRKALDWCEMRDFLKDGLICSQEADDWADLMSNHGHVLFTNALMVWATRLASTHLREIYPEEAKHWGDRSELTATSVRTMFWPAAPGTFVDKTHFQVRAQMSLTLRSVPFFVPWISVFEFGKRFDTPGNLMAILSGVASQPQASSILNFIRQEGMDTPYPVRVLHPVVQPGESDWRDYFMVWGHGLPYHYQNGGSWPWVGAFYIAALVKAGKLDRAQEQLIALAHALKQGKDAPWECNEWLHGQRGEAMGAKFQAWSAGMFLYALHCVETGEVPGF